MKTASVTLYNFSELSEAAKENAISNIYDINTPYDWWECTFYDAKNVGLEIKEFDIDRGSYIKAVFMQDSDYTANKIKENHGEATNTYKIAKCFLDDWADLVAKHSDGVNTDSVAEANEYEFDNEADELEKEFLREICEEYHAMLRNEYEYLTSEQCIIDTIEANEYDFTEDGEIY